MGVSATGREGTEFGHFLRGEPLLNQFLERWHSVSWVSILDILIVAVLVYQFLLLVKGTRAAQIVVGIAMLGVAFYVARLGELTTVNWLVSTLLPYGVFAAIVVFQNEIRRALAKLGRKLTFRSNAVSMGSEGYDDIVLAANLFSQNQTGALIVIERDIGLRTYIESGVPLDAHLSYDLLATIFRPSAPLHDGAAIVQGERIAAAACFLPLSMNPVLSTQLGTRHRAAIGITEETDAVAVVVSEETGAISLAVAGSVERELTADELRLRLVALLHKKMPATALPRQIITEPQFEVADTPEPPRAKPPLPPTAVPAQPAPVKPRYGDER